MQAKIPRFPIENYTLYVLGALDTNFGVHSVSSATISINDQAIQSIEINSIVLIFFIH